jgi:phospholipid transport system transporter-binding protein
MVNIKIEGEQLLLSGELTLLTITKALESKLKSFFNGPSLTVNLNEISKIDTAGLAWLLTIVEQALVRSCQLRFINVSPELIKLAQLTSVEPFLPIE